MRNLNHFRQGDVYISKVDSVDKKGFTKRQPKDNNLVIAYGEVTGHHHSVALLDNPNVDLYENVTGDMILEVNGVSTTLTHQEHAPITLDPGIYECYIQEEYDPEGMRRVVD